MTRLDGSVCPRGASCKPISTTAVCTYDGPSGPPGPPGPPPPPGPGPPPPPGPAGGDYGNPFKGPCANGNENTTITGLPGSFCSPACSSARPCPTDVPPPATATPLVR